MPPKKRPLKNATEPTKAKVAKTEDELDMKKFNAQMKKLKSELTKQTNKGVQLVKKHKKRKDTHEAELQMIEQQLKANKKKHEQKIKKLRAETAKSKKELLKQQEYIKSHPVEPDVEKKLAQETKKKDQLKGKCLEIQRNMIKPEVEANGGEPLDWQCCDICMEPFDRERSPKVLECGHTLCLVCCRDMNKFGIITCPFDESETRIERTEDDLPDNLSIKELCVV